MIKKNLFLLGLIISFTFVEADPPWAGELHLSLKQAVEIGILKNREVIVEKYLHRMSLEKILEAKGIFDPVLLSSLEGLRSEIPIAEIFYPTGYYKEKALRGGLGLKGKIFSGADYGIDVFMERYTTTSQVVTLSPRYSTRLEFSLIQPLLKDFGESILRTKIRMAEQGVEATKHDVKERVIRTVNSVEEGYWNLVMAREIRNFHQEALNVAQRLIQEVEVKVKAGELAPIELIRAKSEAALMEENLIFAENELKKTEFDLKLILGIPEEEDHLIPLDTPNEIIKRANLSEAMELAYKNRADLQAAKFRIEQKKIEEQYLKNQLLPKLDLIGKYGKRGLSGRPSPVIGSGGEPVGDRVKGTPFEGETSPWDAFDDILPTYGYNYWSVGLKFEFPLGNRTAEGKYRYTKLERLKMETELKGLSERISNEIKKAALDIDTALKMREAAKMTMEFMAESLRVEEKRLRAGESTVSEVLKIQKDLTEARARYLKALVEYHKAWSRLRMAEGTSLEEYEIEFNEKIS
ncbi:MAG: TolC family protein [Candidatus Anstonellales archaeon]